MYFEFWQHRLTASDDVSRGVDKQREGTDTIAKKFNEYINIACGHFHYY